MNILICGSRNFNNYEILKKIVGNIVKVNKIEYKDIMILSGHASGADVLGERFAQEYNVKIKKFIPDWDKNGKSAGFIRNAEMIKEANYVIAFWDGESHGTKNTIDLAKKKNIPLFVYRF